MVRPPKTDSMNKLISLFACIRFYFISTGTRTHVNVARARLARPTRSQPLNRNDQSRTHNEAAAIHPVEQASVDRDTAAAPVGAVVAKTVLPTCSLPHTSALQSAESQLARLTERLARPDHDLCCI